ncbi:bifunctional 3-(3-hydroxy-phenyl)propionate/3-hydroxycinnamic acid hydroxylase [Amphritea sp.]|uniref:bifunctional 3-(3-hydroxy-phenyl)propionate/3-hydroxycinnamic acid hydroxylase MhpA n=1 Tax=Amphritea sp. TaxID=1872502 RepID=UPI003D0F307C
MSKQPTEHYDVAIIGFGPVGATLANLLGKCGVSVLILDREAAAYHLPRAVHFDDEVMRVFQTVGLGDAIAANLRVNPGMRFVANDGTLLLDWPRPQQISPQGWYASYRCHQPDIEKVLREGLERYPHVTVRTLCEVVNLEEQCDRAMLEYHDLREEKTVTVSANYVVGCDGANSLVRRFIETGMEDLGFSERWLVVDVLLNREKPELGDYTIQYCNPERPATYVRGPGNRRRWEITVKDDEPSEEMISPDAVWSLLQPWLDSSEAELERSAVYTFNSKIVHHWRKGRFLLAGDAAHLTPPFMGQGMCAGIRDVANLGWKLALCVTAQAPDSLLDTYGTERYPHVREYIGTAVRLGGLINTCGTEEALNAALYSQDGSARMTSIYPALGRGMSVAGQTACLFPQPRLKDGTLSDDRHGYGFALLSDPRALPLSAAQLEQLKAKNIALLQTDQSEDLAQYLEQFKAHAVLVRPDRYLLGTACNQAELQQLLDRSLVTPAQCV